MLQVMYRSILGRPTNRWPQKDKTGLSELSLGREPARLQTISCSPTDLNAQVLASTERGIIVIAELAPFPTKKISYQHYLSVKCTFCFDRLAGLPNTSSFVEKHCLLRG